MFFNAFKFIILAFSLLGTTFLQMPSNDTTVNNSQNKKVSIDNPISQDEKEIPQIIDFNIFKFRPYEQIGKFNELEAFHFLYPGNIYVKIYSEGDTSIESWYYYNHGIDYDSNLIVIRDSNSVDFAQEYSNDMESDSNYKDESELSFSEDDIKVTHMIGIKDFIDANKEYKFIFFRTSGIYGYHFVPGYFGYAVFIKYLNTWKLIEFYPFVAVFGHYGYFPPPIDVFKLNKETYAIYLNIPFNRSFGDEERPLSGYSVLLTKIDNKFKMVFIYGGAYCDSEPCENNVTEWESEIVVDKTRSSHGLYNIKVFAKGIYDPENFENHEWIWKNKWDSIKVDNTRHYFEVIETFLFNGEEYIFDNIQFPEVKILHSFY